MNTYTRKQINIKAHLHGEQFVTVSDATQAMQALVDIALECGADEVALLEQLGAKPETH